MLISEFNCWIRLNGESDRVPCAQHATYYNSDSGHCIRISMPEFRRTWVGVEVQHKATIDARKTCLSMVRKLRGLGYQIIAEIYTTIEDNPTIIECMSCDRPTKLNKAIRGQ